MIERIDIQQLCKKYPSIKKMPKGKWFQLGKYRECGERKDRVSALENGQKKSRDGILIYFFIDYSKKVIDYIGITYTPL
jgi:hypothetical protein